MALPLMAATFVEPMKCLLATRLPEGDQWIYEVKFDGFRALAVKSEKKVELLSRNHKDLAARYPTLPEPLKKLPCKSAVLDGEIVALDETGRSSFQLLQSQNVLPEHSPGIFYYLFDLLQLNGRDLKSLPVTERKSLLQQLLRGTDHAQLRFSPALPGDASDIEKQIAALNLEGIIAKKKDSKYEPGRRTGAWVKFKWIDEQEFVIGGYTRPEGSRLHFGALLIGYHDIGRLRFASKVGTGFDRRTLETLHAQFQKLRIAECPFVNLPEPRNIAGNGGITRAQMRLCTWIEPRLVCQVRFTEWTRDGHLRHPSFLGLRSDKSAAEVTREIPV